MDADRPERGELPGRADLFGRRLYDIRPHHRFGDRAVLQQQELQALGRRSRRVGLYFLDWLERYLVRTGTARRDIQATIRHQRWLQAHPRVAELSMDLEIFVRRWRRRLLPWTRPHSIRMPARKR